MSDLSPDPEKVASAAHQSTPPPIPASNTRLSPPDAAQAQQRQSSAPTQLAPSKSPDSLLSGASNGAMPRAVTMSVKPRSRSSVMPRPGVPTRQKLRQASFSADQSAFKPLNTHSPIAMAAAAAVTSDKIKKLLVAQGPLPIRHITSHLSATIPGFGELSLSKQRRLIIAVLDGPRSDFVKVGWGRWAVDGHEYTETMAATASGAAPSSGSAANAQPGPKTRAAQQQHHLIANRTPRGSLSGAQSLSFSSHRESISRQLPDSKPPLSPPLGPVEDNAVFSDSESSDNDYDDSEVEGTDEEDWRAMGPAQLRQTSPREQDAIAALVQLRSN